MGARSGRLLIANRGEIAVRVIRACRELGIEAVAVHEPGDAARCTRELADDAVACRLATWTPGADGRGGDAGADAVHPGYGYLAENAEFAEAVRARRAGVGRPAAGGMRSLGDKIEARRLAEAAGVPVVPGYAGVDLADATLIAEAARVGSPLLVKAAAGGGGRGMRARGRPRPSWRRRSPPPGGRRAAAFGDDRVYLERAVVGARHVEVQVLADAARTRASTWASATARRQRRHQKIVEESPSPAVDDELRAPSARRRSRSPARPATPAPARSSSCSPADGAWWFLEVNARLQVEHPVTEAVAGIDLVRAQLDIAAGAPAGARAGGRAHCAVTRSSAGSTPRIRPPASSPATGALLRFRVPLWPGVRVDSGVREGDAVGVGYDPLLAKLIAHAEDRDACLDRMAAALRRDGSAGRRRTNLGFLEWLIAQPAFRSGDLDTGYVEREWSPSLVPVLPEDVRRRAAAGLAPAGSPWFADQPGPAPVAVDGLVLHDGWQYAVGGDEAEAAGGALPAGALEAPMPGTVLRVDVAPGQAVQAGQTLVVLEAMKMELSVAAPVEGIVRDVHVTAGQLVARGQALVELEEDG